jgi:hypothetical protein
MESMRSRKRFFDTYLCSCRRVCSKVEDLSCTYRKKQRTGRSAKDGQKWKDREGERKSRRKAFIGPARKLPEGRKGRKPTYYAIAIDLPLMQ